MDKKVVRRPWRDKNGIWRSDQNRETYNARVANEKNVSSSIINFVEVESTVALLDCYCLVHIINDLAPES